MITLSTETNCSPLDAWSTWTALSLHFNQERNYDAFKFNFKGPRCKRETFMSHKNRYQFECLARSYPNRNDVILYSLSNLIAGNKWIGDCTDDTYIKWQGRIQALDYTFKEDIGALEHAAAAEGLNFDSCIMPNKPSVVPLIYRLYSEGLLHLETLAILENMLNFTETLNKKLIDPLEVSKNISFLVSRYAPFLVHKMKLSVYTENIISVFTK